MPGGDDEWDENEDEDEWRMRRTTPARLTTERIKVRGRRLGTDEEDGRVEEAEATGRGAREKEAG
jgi:hypothetical protein